MGGIGSGGGRWAPRTSQMKRIDLVQLKRLGMLSIGRRSNLRWSCNGEPIGDINLARRESSVDLDYRVRSPGEEWRPIQETISLDRTQQHLGGERLWFRCPGCWKRRRVLYGGELFRCRKCYGATYPSQYEPLQERLITRAQNIRMKLGASGSIDEPFPSKPKFMRWNTYNRLEKQDEVAQEMFLAILYGWEMKLGSYS